MQVVLNADHHIDGKHEMAEHLRVIVRDAVAQFGVHVTRVVAHIADENSTFKTSPDDIQCTLEVGLIGREPVIVKARAGSVDQAIHGAVEKLKQAVAIVLQKHDPRPAQWPDS